jgi:glutamate synthase (NADPH/NADH) small chain
MPYLIRQNKINASEPYEDNPFLDANGKNVVVIGGGDTGSDCIGTALRQGAQKVYQLEILPKPPDTRPDSTPWPAWPNMLRTSSSHKEGPVERLWSVSTKAFIGDENGAVKGLTGCEIEWEKGADGRFGFKEKPGTEFTLQAELVALAMGFTGPRKNRLIEDLGIELDAGGKVTVDENHMTNYKGVFASGDMAIGQSLIVRALADGRKTADAIIRYLEEYGRTTLI